MTTRSHYDFISRRENTWRRGQNTVAFAHTAKLGPVSHTVLIAVMVATLGLIYLTQITKTSSYGYALDKLSTQKTDLADKKSELEVESAKLKSFKQIQSSDVAKNMTTPTSTDYIH
jgi:hypothetical protein